MTQSIEEETQNRNHTSNQLKNNQIKMKKNSLGYDRQHLYAQNLELKNRIRELTDMNTKIKTQLSVTEKEKINLCNFAEEEAFKVNLPQRSQSGNHKKALTNLQPYGQNMQGSFALHKEKHNTALKKLIREQTIEIEKLNNENQRIKKTMKYTRMNELHTENQQLLSETLRLKAVIVDKKDNEKMMFSEYMTEIETLRKKLAQEKDSQKKNGFELKRQMELNGELKEKICELQSKKVDAEKRVARENKLLKNELSQIRSKLYEQTVVKKKECQRQQCTKNLKEKNELKKKNESHQKENLKLKQQITLLKRHSLQQDYDSKKVEQERSLSKTPEKKQQSQNNSHVKKVEIHNNVVKNSSSGPEVQTSKCQAGKVESGKKVQDPEVASIVIEPRVEEKKAEVEVKPKVKDNLFVQVKDPRVSKKQKTDKSLPEDSMNTEKLLQSVEADIDKQLILESGTQLNEEKKEVKKEEEPDNLDPKLMESDGQYEALDYDEFQNVEEKQKDSKHIKTQKAKAQEKKHTLGDAEKKKKEKSKKKLVEDVQLIEGQKTKQIDKKEKAGLKLIKDTLVYKFMAQNYSYENFVSDLKQNKDIKQFSVEDILSLLGTEPFLLYQEQVETVVIYLFGTDHLTGNETLSSKDFMKKMKKFIGNTINYDEQELSLNIQTLQMIIKKDERGPNKMKKMFRQCDKGDGTINLDDFSKAMGSVKIKDQILQTAIAQITYVSQDISHLNYDLFLKRFQQKKK